MRWGGQSDSELPEGECCYSCGKVSGRWQECALESTVIPLWRSCWFPCWETCNFTKGRFSFLLAFSIWAVTTAKTWWSHHQLSQPTIKPWLPSPTVTLCLNACRSLQIKTKYSSWGLTWGFLFARFGWGVGWGLLPPVTFFHAVCTFVFPLRTRN